jgi:hypothetical protein
LVSFINVQLSIFLTVPIVHSACDWILVLKYEIEMRTVTLKLKRNHGQGRLACPARESI